MNVIDFCCRNIRVAKSELKTQENGINILKEMNWKVMSPNFSFFYFFNKWLMIEAKKNCIVEFFVAFHLHLLCLYAKEHNLLVKVSCIHGCIVSVKARIYSRIQYLLLRYPFCLRRFFHDNFFSTPLISPSISLFFCFSVYIYIYIYIEREREMNKIDWQIGKYILFLLFRFFRVTSLSYL